MNLFPNDYKKNDSISGLGSAKAEPVDSALQKIKAKFSFGEGDFASSVQTRAALASWGVIISSVVLAVILLSWGGLVFYKKSLVAQISDLKQKQSEVFNNQEAEMAAQIVAMDKTAAEAQDLLKTHIYSSGIFDRLSAATMPKVQWQSFGFSVKEGTISTKGFAADYATLAKQILLFKESNFFDVRISSISLDKSGGVSFGAAFKFDPKILQKP